MTPHGAVISTFRKTLDISGRTGRAEYWWFVLFAFTTAVILSLIPIAAWVFSAVAIAPFLTATQRRVHDANLPESLLLLLGPLVVAWTGWSFLCFGWLLYAGVGRWAIGGPLTFGNPADYFPDPGMLFIWMVLLIMLGALSALACLACLPLIALLLLPGTDGSNPQDQRRDREHPSSE